MNMIIEGITEPFLIFSVAFFHMFIKVLCGPGIMSQLDEFGPRALLCLPLIQRIIKYPTKAKIDHFWKIFDSFYLILWIKSFFHNFIKHVTFFRARIVTWLRRCHIPVEFEQLILSLANTFIQVQKLFRLAKTKK